MKKGIDSDEVLTKLFGSISRARILSFLYAHAGQSFYQREIMYETGLSLRPVQILDLGSNLYSWLLFHCLRLRNRSNFKGEEKAWGALFNCWQCFRVILSMIPCHDQPDSTNQDFFNMSSFEGLRKGIFFLTMRTETILLGGCQRCCWKLEKGDGFIFRDRGEKKGRAVFDWRILVIANNSWLNFWVIFH